ncbi:MAG: glycosyltransferase family 4 protein [Opitutaceae bacterium]|nr:glycosyltransferase family 4 protein [Opitutaceae bacterium]
MASSPQTIAYLFTTFPKATETFLQREIIAMQRMGARLELHSLWGGGGRFGGMPVHAFNKWLLLKLLWVIPWVALTRRDVFGVLLKGLLTRGAPSWLNFWENMLGAGFAGVFYRSFRRRPPALIHAAWGGAPATAAWCLYKMNGTPYSMAAHAYDLYEHGGDWWLDEKLAEARFIHTSTDMGRATLIKRGVRPDRVHLIRRGLDALPVMKRLRPSRLPLRIVCVARLVEKKGLREQMKIHAALRDAGVGFEARIVGDGPLRDELALIIRKHNLAGRVLLTGQLSLDEVWGQLAWADVLVHTGIVAASGDRDGLPNVIPEAMSIGAMVVSSPVAATTEAVRHGVTGLVADVARPDAWVAALRRLATDAGLAESLRAEARRWVEENFDAHKNAARLHACFEEQISRRASGHDLL